MGYGYFPRIPLSPARTKEDKIMEDIKIEDNLETATEETSPEQQEQVETTEVDTTVETEEDSEDIDFSKELEALEAKPKNNELEKAEKSLHFNAQRVKELGGDPSKIIKPEQKTEQVFDPSSVEALVDGKFAEQQARTLAKTDAEFKVIMWYVRNKGLSISEAHLLANKSRIERFASEVKRSNVAISKGGVAGRRVEQTQVPARSQEEVNILSRRGLKFNPKTKTYQGKIYEEYYTGSGWASRKIQK